MILKKPFRSYGKAHYSRGPHITFVVLLSALTMKVKRTRCTLYD